MRSPTQSPSLFSSSRFNKGEWPKQNEAKRSVKRRKHLWCFVQQDRDQAGDKTVFFREPFLKAPSRPSYSTDNIDNRSPGGGGVLPYMRYVSRCVPRDRVWFWGVLDP